MWHLYKGFQYIEVTSDQALELTENNWTGYFMYSDVPPIGHIQSSNPTLNKIWEETNNPYLSNLFGYPAARWIFPSYEWKWSLTIESGIIKHYYPKVFN